MSPQQNAARTLAGITGVKFGKMIRGEVSEDEMSKLWATADSFPGGQFFLEPSIMTANQFHEHVVKLKEKVQADGKTLRAVFLDYVQLMADYAGSREQNISNISRTCKAVAHETGVVMVVGSQLNRELERREDKRPILADLRESGSLEQDADQVLMVYRPAVYYASAPEEDAELIVRKNRWGESGVAEVGWNGKGARFENLSPTSSHRESMQH
jgi:replicative DNA helicase